MGYLFLSVVVILYFLDENKQDILEAIKNNKTTTQTKHETIFIPVSDTKCFLEYASQEDPIDFILDGGGIIVLKRHEEYYNNYMSRYEKTLV